MKLIIDIDKESYENIMAYSNEEVLPIGWYPIINGKPLTESCGECKTLVDMNNKLKHFITCLKCEISGKCCNDNCPTQYEAGNMGEIVENLEMISKILE